MTRDKPYVELLGITEGGEGLHVEDSNTESDVSDIV